MQTHANIWCGSFSARWASAPQKALRGVIPAPLCPALGAILWDFLSKVEKPAGN